MQLLFSDGYFQSHLIQAICRTLVHSIWQGLASAALAGIIILATRKSKAAFRYNLLSLIFAAFVLTTLITFLIQPGLFNTSEKEFSVLSIRVVETGISPSVKNETLWFTSLQIESVYKNAIFYADKYAAIITGTWLLFFFIHLLRMGTGLHYAYRIRTQQVIGADDHWKERLAGMAQMMGIRKTVSLMESAIVKVPVVTGMLKPMILVPLGMLSNLSTQQVETILLHELAHVRRRDFLINLLQRFTESIFFFNPFLLWISSRIREEREACCDDIVLEHTDDKRSYLEALISFREAVVPAYSHAMTLGSNNKLLYRVKRMITQENKKLNAMEKITLVLLLTAGTAFSFMPAANKDKKNEEHAISGQQVKSVSQTQELPTTIVQSVKNTKPNREPKDTLPKELLKFPNVSSVNNDDGKTRSSLVTAKASNGNTYNYKIEDGKIVELAVNGEKIRKDDFYKYQSIVDQIEIVRGNETQKAIWMQQMDAARLHKEQALLNSKLIQLQAADHADMLKKMSGAEIQSLKLQSENKLRLLAQQDQAMLLDQKLELNKQQQTDLGKLLAEKDQLRQANDNLAMLKLQHSDKLDLLEAQKGQATLQLLESKNRLLAAQDDQFHDSNFTLSLIIADLAEANLFEDKINLGFTLNNDELIVDGKKQPSDVHETFRKKYIRNKKDHYIYKAGPNTRATDIYVE